MSIALQNLSFTYPGRDIFQGVSLNIQKGEWIGIVGPNGGGKSTLLQLLMGFFSPSSGQILIEGKSPQEQRLKIGYVPQNQSIEPDFPITLKELVLLGSLKGRNLGKDAEKKAETLLKDFELFSFRNVRFSLLSGGLMQRALFVRALISDPDILLLDEPTSNMDPISSEILLNHLNSYKGTKTMLLVTHDLATILERVDRMLFVQNNLVCLKPSEVCEHFALGLYHAPIQKNPENHLRSHVAPCAVL